MRVLLLVVFLTCLTSCSMEDMQVNKDQDGNISEAKSTVTETESEPELITVRGTIHFKTMEGGFYALDADDGRKFMPRGMDKDLLKNGMVVEVSGFILEDMLTFQQYGQVLKVKTSKMIDSSQVKGLNEF